MEFSMVLHRVIKWAAAGVLALGAIPAIGLAHLSQASLPTAGITVTPTRYNAPASRNVSYSHVSHPVHAAKLKPVKASLHNHIVKHHTAVSSKHSRTAGVKHHLTTAASHKHLSPLHRTATTHHVTRTSAHQTHKSTARTIRRA
jgi:hypothetical protein